MKRRYVLDTNHLSAAIAAVSHVRERIHSNHRAGFRFGTCVPILSELEIGIRQRGDAESRRRTLNTVLSAVAVWPISPDLIEVYADIYLELRAAGRALSQFDMVLAALARDRGATLLTTDRDFEGLPDIRTENWVAENVTK